MSGGAIALAGIAAYANSFSGPFVFDDVPGIVQNPSLRSLLAAFSPPPDGLTVSGRPVLNLSLAVNHAFGGDSPWGYHAVNLLIHIVAALALFGIVRHSIGRWSGRLVAAKRSEDGSLARFDIRNSGGPESVSGPVVASLRRGKRAAPPVLVPLCVALLWELHPLQTESVTYVIQRAESLMGMFYLLSLYCFIRYTQSETGGFFTGRSGGMPSKPFLQEDRKDREGRHLGGLFIPGPATETTAVLPDLPDLPAKKTTAPQPLRDLCDLPVKKDNSTKACFPIFLSEKHWLGKSACAVLSVICCALAMGTKEVAVSIPLVIFLYDRTFVSGTFREAWRRRRRYYGALAATWILLGWEVAGAHGRGGTAGFGTGVPWTLYLLTQFKAVVHYLGLAVWPNPLVFDYARHLVVSPVAALPYAALLAALAAAALWALAAKEPGRRAFGFAGVWFFLILAPSSSVVPVATEVVAEHRMYLALIPIIAIVVCAIAHMGAKAHRGATAHIAEGGAGGLPRRSAAETDPSDALTSGTRAGRKAYVGPSAPPIFVAALGAAALAGIALTATRNRVYASELTLWRDTVSKQPDDALARYNFGIDLLRGGDTEAAKGEFEQAVRLAPDYADAYVNLGNVLQQEGRNQEAMADFQRALAYKPGSAEAHDDLGIALANSGQLEQAVAEFQAAVRLNPGLAGAHANLGGALVNSGRVQEGIDEFQLAIRLDPGFAQAHYNLGQVLQALGRGDEARAEMEEAARLQSR